jgi:hypothetical protein
MWPHFRDVENIKSVSFSIFFGHSLNEPVPARIVALSNFVVEIVGAVLRILRTLSGGFLSCKILYALGGLVVVLNIVNLFFVINPSKCVGRVTIHVSITIRSSTIAEENSNLMKCLRRVSPEIKCHVRILSIV